MSRIFAIGDVHGCAKTLQKLLSEELHLEKDDDIYFLGDYIDRGPASKEVIDVILNLKNENFRIHTMRRNHEQMFIDSEKSIDHFYNWIKNGGMRTLESFGILRFIQLDDPY